MQQAWDSLWFKARVAITLLRLKLRFRLNGGELAVDYGWAKLPFTNDGDLQEAMYHAHAKAWHAKAVADLAAHIRPGGCVLDVGANLGFMSLIFRELVGPDGTVLAFEPSAATFRKLQRVFELNQCRNITAYNKGCGDHAAQMTLYHTGLSSGNSSVLGSTGEHQRGRSEPIEIVRLDEFVLPLAPKVDFIKIDTEGFEPAVLRGATGLVRRDRPIFHIELNSEFVDPCRESISILESYGYRFLNKPDLEAGHVLDDFTAVPVEAIAQGPNDA
jgi:FkbM family methyltransferase